MPTNGISRSLSKSVRIQSDAPPIPKSGKPPSNLSASSRSRAISSADPPSSKLVSSQSITRKASLSAGIAAPSAFKEIKSAPPTQRHIPDMESGFPKKNRHVKRDSLDLDDLSDEGPAIRKKASNLAAKPNASTSSTRELIDFLSEGPPEVPQSPETAKPKSGSRLRTMVSRLARGSSERLKAEAAAQSKTAMPPAVRPSASASLNAVKSRSTYTPPPVPYYPRPSSPHSHSSSSNDLDSPEAVSTHKPRNGATPVWEPARAPPVSTPTTPSSPMPSAIRANSHREATIIKGLPSPAAEVDKMDTPATPRSAPSKAQAQSINASPSTPAVNGKAASAAANMSVPRMQASHLREGVLKATSPHECRLLVDMFLARCGFELPTEILQADAMMTPEQVNEQELSMVDILLGEGPVFGFATNGQDAPQTGPAVVEAAA